MDRYAAGAMEIGADPVPPVPPDLDLDLDLEIDFDSLPEIEIPGEVAQPPPPPPPKPAAQEVPAIDEGPRRRFAWWPLLGGTLALLVVALAAVPFAIVRLNGMSQDMSLLSERVEQAEAENARLTDTLAQEAVDAVSTHLADTERRIDRIRGALDEVRRVQPSPAVASAPREEPKPAPAAAKRPGLPEPVEPNRPELPTPVEPRPDPPRPVATAPLLPPPPDLDEAKGRPLVGASKKDRVEPIAPASAVRSAPTPPVPVEKGGGKVELPVPLPREEPKAAPPSGRILLPTELYDENED